MTLVGRTEGFSDGSVHFAGDLARNIAAGDEYYLSFLDQCDAYLAARRGSTCRKSLPRATCWMIRRAWASPLERLDLTEANVSTIIWGDGLQA